MTWSILSQHKPKAHSGKKLAPDALLSAASRGCEGCTLNHEKLEHPKMLATGAVEPVVYMLGEAPGADEDEQGEQFVGLSGRYLRDQIPKEWKDRIRWDNVADCRPPNNREPSSLEIACCRPRQQKDIAHSKPRLILGFGGVPLSWAAPGMSKISAWRGRLMPIKVGAHRCWFMPMLHPAYVLRARHMDKGDAVEDLFKRDMATAFSIVDDLPTPEVEDPKEKDAGVIHLGKSKLIIALLERLKGEWDDAAIDLETTGIRPYAKDSAILTCSLSQYGETYAFPIAHPEAKFTPREVEDILVALCDLIVSGKPLIAHNSKFEQEWLAKFLGARIVHDGAWRDTMAQAYVLDEREGAKSLEALSIINLGMNVKALRPRSGHKVDAGNLKDEALVDVLDYNAYDSKYTYLIYWLQKEKLEREKLVSVFHMMDIRAGPLALAQLAGVQPDTKVAAEFNKEYKAKIEKIEDAIQRNADVKAFVKKHTRFLPTSNKDLPELFYRQLGFKECVVKADKHGQATKLSCDESVLSKIDHPVARNVLELRGLDKLRGTYVVPMLEGGKHIWADGLVHTTYNHLLTGTGRLSSEDPNLQNYPARKAREVRRVIAAFTDHWFVATDYGQIEARVIAMASECPVLIKALWEGYDIHGAWAERLAHAYPRRVGGKAKIKDKAVMKEFRNEVKNLWTFPLFFGSAMESVSTGLEIPRNVIAPLYDEFWEMFEAVHTWQETLKKFYRKNGYVESLTGRRRHGPLSFNEQVNTPIQGTASDIVVDAGNRLSKRAYEEDRPQLQFRLNIHDDLSFYIPEKSLDEDIADIATEMVKLPYDFMSRAPVVVEVKVGRNWGELEEMGVVSSVDYGHKRDNK